MAWYPFSEPDWFPFPPTDLSGRETERALARSLLLDAAVPLLTLTGPGGIGKTRLSLAIAEDLAHAFADGAVFVDFAPQTNPDLVASTIATALNIDIGDDPADLEAIIARLRSSQCLLLLDNCEHLLGVTATHVSRLLAHCPALQVLATSRAALHIRGEQVLRVPPLEAPRIGSNLDEVRSAPATALFVKRAQSVDANFTLVEQNAEAISELCRRLDGLPLAIELAAARCRVLSPAALLALLSQRLRVLGTGPRDAPDRHQTIQAAISWSYDLLGPEQQALFRRLAVFSGGWSIEAAAAIGELDLSDAVIQLDSLIDQSLAIAIADASTGAQRFSMLETIRAFGLERLRSSGDEERARDLHAAFFNRFVTELDLYAAFPADPSWFTIVAPEEDNLRLALEHFLWRDDSLALCEVVTSLEPFWLTRCQFAEGRGWVERAMSRDEGLPTVVRARVRGIAGRFLMYYGQSDISLPILEDAVTMARDCNDPITLEQTLQALGTALLDTGENARALEAFEEAELHARTLLPSLHHAGLNVGAELCFQGVVVKRMGDLSSAVRLFSEAIPFLRTPGGNRRLGMLLAELGGIQAISGNLQEATTTLVEAIALSWKVRDDPSLPCSLRGLAMVVAASQPLSAAHLLGAADAVDSSTPSPARGAKRDRNIIDRCLEGLTSSYDTSTVARARQAGASLSVEGSVALAIDVATLLLGAGRVDEIWSATGAPRPKPISQEDLDADSLQDGESVVFGWNLTRREREVLILLCKRMTDSEIAQALYISPRTASGHVASTLRKLKVTNRRDAAVIAARSGLFSSERQLRETT